MKSHELAVGAAVLLCLTACASDDTTTPTTTSTNTTPVTPVESPTASSPTPETSAESTAPLSTAPVTATPATDPVETSTLQQIVQPYETGSFTEYAIESCYTRPQDEQPPLETPFVSDPVPLDTTVQRSDVFLCTIRTEPPADVGHLGLIVLDDIRTTAAWGGSDYPEMPFVGPCATSDNTSVTRRWSELLSASYGLATVSR